MAQAVIVDVVRSLDDHASVRDALRAHGIDENAERPYVRALGTLADSHMIVPA